ncbi:8432_t:CDS:2, partial [Scutellospora calospora]
MYKNLSNFATNPFEDLIQKCINEEHIKFYEYTRFKDVNLIGEGGYGKVYRATLKNNEITVALKSFKSNNVAINEVVNELKLHRKVDMHSNIIRLHGATENKDIEQHQIASLILDISNGTRENCWQHDPDKRPDIQQVFSDLENLIINDGQSINGIKQYNTNEINQIILEQNKFTFDSNL